MKIRLLLLSCVLLLVSCGKEGGGSGSGESESWEIHTWAQMKAYTPVVNSHKGAIARSCITLIGGTYVQVPAEQLMMTATGTGVVYPRFVKTAAGDYLMFYHYGSESTWAGATCAYARSADLINWTFEKKLFTPKSGQSSRHDGSTFTRAYAGADICALPDGRILVVAASRHTADMRHKILDDALAIRYSSDNGKTWTDDKLVHVGAHWEPKPLVLPDGTIQIYYTDSRPYIEGVWDKAVVSTGSSYIYSQDNGRSWKPTPVEEVHQSAFREYRASSTDGNTRVYTDQMPAVIVLNGTTRLAAAMEADKGSATVTEDGKTSLASSMYISLAYSGDNYDWGTPDSDTCLPVPEQRVNWFTKGASPYLIQFPSGETVLCYNNSNIFYYRMGDETAHNFGPEQRVFPGVTPIGRGFWGTMYVTGPNTMVAGIGGTSSVKMMQVGQFWLNHDISAKQINVKLDGRTAEWPAGDALFAGTSSESHVILRSAKDADRLYLLAEIEGENAYPKIELGVNGALKSVVVNSSGLRSSDFKAADAKSFEGETAAGVKGFASEISIPLSELGGASQVPVKLTLILQGGVQDSFSPASQAIAALPAILL